MTSLENEYVHQVYSRLATYSRADKPSSPRVWPNVKRFVEKLRPGSNVIDIGCGEGKYRVPNGFLLGVDTCPDVLMSVKNRNRIDLILGDALNIPFREKCADAVLCISVLHHLSTLERRRLAVEEIGRMLAPRGRVLIYVWAFEQPNGTFPSQDLLVPWNLHENTIHGRLPQVKFHKDSTKEQRIIQASIPIEVPDDPSSPCPPTSWFTNFLNKLKSFSNPPSPLPPPTPKFFPNSKTSIISGIRRWSPMLGRRLASLFVSVEELIGDEMSETIMAEAMTEALASLRKVTFYRFYHVFRRGELEELVDSTDTLKVVSSQFEHGNWCVIAERIPDIELRIN